MTIRHHLPAVLLAATLSLFANIAAADEITPTSATAAEKGEPAQTAEQPSLNFEEQSKLLTGVYPLSLDHMEQVTQHSYNWQGRRDASLACEIGFTPQAIVFKGSVLDDQPFVQPIAYPAKPDWWETTYAADGIELLLEDPTSATNRMRLIMNFSSAGLNPKIQVLEAPLIDTAGVLTSAELKVRSLQAEDIPSNLRDKTTPVAGYRFQTAIPATGLAEPKFFSGALRMTVRLHDLDGGIETYLKMEEVVEKRE